MSNYALRLPESLMKNAKRLARKEKTSLNQLFVSAIAEKISAIETEELLTQRASQASVGAYRKVLEKVKDEPPADEDSL